MTIALAISAGLLALGAVVAWLVPISVAFSFEARLTPDGRWAVGGGAEVGPVSFAGVAARGLAPRIVVVVAGRRVFAHVFEGKPEKKRPEGPAVPLAERIEQARRLYARVERWIDPAEVGLFLIDEQERLRLGFLDVTLRFGADDVAVTGKVVGAVIVLDGLFGGRVTLRPDPVFSGEEVAEVKGRGRVRLYPVRFVLDLSWFLVRQFHVFPPKAVDPRAKAHTP